MKGSKQGDGRRITDFGWGAHNGTCRSCITKFTPATYVMFLTSVTLIKLIIKYIMHAKVLGRLEECSVGFLN